MGLVFTGQRADRPATGGGSSTATSSAAPAPGPTFAERLFTACAATRRLRGRPRSCFVSDGAPAIRWIRERAFPDAIELLDWYHLVEALRGGRSATSRPIASSRPSGRGGPGTSRLSSPSSPAMPRALERDDPEQARAAPGGHRLRHQQPPRHRATTAIVPLASSGPMEKGVDIVVCRRFKTRGMSWFRRGVSHLLHLRLLRLNGTWDRYWAGRFAELHSGPGRQRPDASTEDWDASSTAGSGAGLCFLADHGQPRCGRFGAEPGRRPNCDADPEDRQGVEWAWANVQPPSIGCCVHTP